MEHCVFCDIISGLAPSARVFESDGALAFLDINPIVEGHTLVVPKRHIRNLFDLPDQDAPALMHAAVRVANGLRAALGADGLNVVQSSEAAAGQVVFHLHLHLLPRFRGDGILKLEGYDRRLVWHVLGHYRPSDLEPTAARIRTAIMTRVDTANF